MDAQQTCYRTRSKQKGLSQVSHRVQALMLRLSEYARRGGRLDQEFNP